MRIIKLKNIFCIALFSMMVFSFSASVHAWEFRQFRLIGPPTFQDPNAISSQELGLQLSDVPHEVVRENVNALFRALASRNVDSLLSPSFPDRARLLDVYNETVPQNINIIVQNVRSIATLPQDEIEWVNDDDPDLGFNRTVTVTATVDTRIQFEFEGQQQFIDGTGDYFFSVVEEYR